MPQEGPRVRQELNPPLFQFRQLRFLQYFCNFEDTPLDKTMDFVPTGFNVEATKSEIYDYILNEIPLETFKIGLGYGRTVPTPEVLRQIFIEHFGLDSSEPAVPYKELGRKYKIRENHIKRMFNTVLDRIREESTYKT